MDLEAHHKFDKTDGIGKELGLAWFDAARYGNLATRPEGPLGTFMLTTHVFFS